MFPDCPGQSVSTHTAQHWFAQKKRSTFAPEKHWKCGRNFKFHPLRPRHPRNSVTMAATESTSSPKEEAASSSSTAKRKGPNSIEKVWLQCRLENFRALGKLADLFNKRDLPVLNIKQFFKPKRKSSSPIELPLRLMTFPTATLRTTTRRR